MWPIIKKAVNSDLSTPLNTLINNAISIILRTLQIVNDIIENVGLSGDAASSTGSLHAKIAHMTATLPGRLAYVSDTLQISADTERSVTDIRSYTRMKEVQVNVPGYIRLYWEGNRSTYQTDNRFAIYVNNVVVIDNIYPGEKSPSFTTHTYDIQVRAGDVIELRGKTADNNTVTVRNFRIYYDVVNSPVVRFD